MHALSWRLAPRRRHNTVREHNSSIRLTRPGLDDHNRARQGSKARAQAPEKGGGTSQCERGESSQHSRVKHVGGLAMSFPHAPLRSLCLSPMPPYSPLLPGICS